MPLREKSLFSPRKTARRERYKELLASCPHHGYESWRLVSYFYDGLTPRERQFVETMCNGKFIRKDPDEAFEYLDDLAKKSHTWSGPNVIDNTDRTHTSPSISLQHFREEDSLKTQVELLTRQVGALIAKDSRTMHSVAQLESQEYPVYGETKETYDEQCHALGTYQKPHILYPDIYNPSWRNHPNLSWKQESHQPSQTSPPRGYSTPQYNTPTVPRNSLEDTVQAFVEAQMVIVEAQNKTNQRFESLIAQVAEDNREIKCQSLN